MKPYNLEVAWSADELHAARIALRACEQINPDDPSKAAQAITDLFNACKRAVAAAEHSEDFIEGAAAYEALRTAIAKVAGKEAA